MDGHCRDLRGIRRVGLPVFARGAYPMSGTMTGPVTIGAPVTVGGCPVRPGDLVFGDLVFGDLVFGDLVFGDLVFGDDDGLVVAPPDRLLAALDAAEEIEPAEAAVAAALAVGTPLAALSNASEHLRTRGAGEPSAFRFAPPEAPLR